MCNAQIGGSPRVSIAVPAANVQNTEVIDDHGTSAVACSDKPKRAIKHLSPSVVRPALLAS